MLFSIIKLAFYVNGKNNIYSLDHQITIFCYGFSYLYLYIIIYLLVTLIRMSINIQNMCSFFNVDNWKIWIICERLGVHNLHEVYNRNIFQ